MANWFAGLNPVMQALAATLFTWFVTALGAALVFFFKAINRKVLDGMLGFAAGVMIAASYWSLLAPAIEMSEGQAIPAWVPGSLVCWAARSTCCSSLKLRCSARPDLRPVAIPTRARGSARYNLTRPQITWRKNSPAGGPG